MQTALQPPAARTPCPDPAPLAQESVQAALDEAVAAGSTARATLASRRTGRLVSLVLRPGSSDQLRPSKVRACVAAGLRHVCAWSRGSSTAGQSAVQSAVRTYPREHSQPFLRLPLPPLDT